MKQIILHGHLYMESRIWGTNMSQTPDPTTRQVVGVVSHRSRRHTTGSRCDIYLWKRWSFCNSSFLNFRGSDCIFCLDFWTFKFNLPRITNQSRDTGRNGVGFGVARLEPRSSCSSFLRTSATLQWIFAHYLTRAGGLLLMTRTVQLSYPLTGSICLQQFPSVQRQQVCPKPSS